MEDLGEIVGEFLVESHENLDQIDRDLVALEQEPDSRDLISRIFRAIHTIKGTSGFLAFSRLETVTHAGESLLSRLRDGVQPQPRRPHHRCWPWSTAYAPARRDRGDRHRGRRSTWPA